MHSEEPTLGVELKRVIVHRQHCTLGPVPASELNQHACAGTISDCLRISVASSSPCSHLTITLPPFCPPSSSSRLPSLPDKDGGGMTLHYDPAIAVPFRAFTEAWKDSMVRSGLSRAGGPA